MTLTGIRTYVLGRRKVVVIDPGSAEESHLDAITHATGRAKVACILLTHLHADHAGGADVLGERLRTTVRAIGRGSLKDGDAIDTDDGALITIHAPGHTPDHTVFHWPDNDAVFCGDLMMGGLDTALVAYDPSGTAWRRRWCGPGVSRVSRGGRESTADWRSVDARNAHRGLTLDGHADRPDVRDAPEMT